MHPAQCHKVRLGETYFHVRAPRPTRQPRRHAVAQIEYMKQFIQRDHDWPRVIGHPIWRIRRSTTYLSGGLLHISGGTRLAEYDESQLQPERSRLRPDPPLWRRSSRCALLRWTPTRAKSDFVLESQLNPGETKIVAFGSARSNVQSGTQSAKTANSPQNLRSEKCDPTQRRDRTNAITRAASFGRSIIHNVDSLNAKSQPVRLEIFAITHA